MTLNIPNIPMTANVLTSYLTDFKAPMQKILEMEKAGDIVRLKRGLFVKASSSYNLALIANHIYGPSYVSKESALRLYGLIPEHVYATTSVCTNRSRIFDNQLGRFSYDILPLDYYRLGINLHEDNGVCYQIATPEKALADLIILSTGVRLRYKNETISYLKDYLRIDMEEFIKLKPERFEEYAEVSKKKQAMLNIAKILR